MSLAKRVSKKGLSDVVTTVLIILMTVAAIGLIWAFVIPMVRDNLANATVDKQIDLTIKTAGGESCVDYNKGILVVNVFKGEEDYEVSKLKFIVISEGSSISFIENKGLKKQTGKDFYLNITGLSSVEKVGVAPYVVDGKKEKLYAAIYANIEDKKCASTAINVSKIADKILNESNSSEGGSGNEGGEDDKGDGSEENPYKIYTWMDLNNVRDDLEGHYILMRDLSADSFGYAGVGDNWNPIGKNIIGAGGEQFRGSFNGNFHTIYDLKIDQVTDGIGLFYEINNSNNHIKDLRILNANLTLPAGTTSGGSYAGILASQIHFGNISNVHVSGSILAGDTAGCLSSVVGDTEIVDSSGSCNIRTTRTNAYNQNGGFVSAVGANTHINRCLSNSTQQTSDAGNGGFMAWLGSASNVVINNSYAIGSMSGSNSYTGGFSGPTNGNNVIYNSYARVTMSAGNCFFGSAYSTLPALNSFYDSGVCTRSSGSGGIVGKTTAQMQTKSTFINAGWDENVWVLVDGSYPKLAWQN